MYYDYDFIDISGYLDEFDILDAKDHALALYLHSFNSTRPLSNDFLRDLFLSRASEIAVMRFLEAQGYEVSDNKKVGEGNEYDLTFKHKDREFKVDVKSKRSNVPVTRELNKSSMEYNCPLTFDEVRNGKLIKGEVEKFIEGKFDYLVAVSTYYNSMSDFKIYLIGSIHRFEFCMKYHNDFYEVVKIGDNISVNNNDFIKPSKVNSLKIKFKDFKPFEYQYLTLTEQYYI